MISQGPDAEDFNPGRFLDNQKNFVPIVGDTKDVYLETEGQKNDLFLNYSLIALLISRPCRVCKLDSQCPAQHPV
jgi:hypothetical protein